MALWENIGKKASETTAKAVHQAKVLTETTKLNGMISEEEKKINNCYYQIGKLYVAMHRSDYEADFAGMIAAVSESEQKIKEFRSQILDIKGVLRCENCGAEVAKGMAFCSSCGFAMPKVETFDTSKYEKCPHCAAVIEKGMRFCTACGTALIVETMPVAVTPLEETPVVTEIPIPMVVETPVDEPVVKMPAFQTASDLQGEAEEMSQNTGKTCAGCGAALEEDAMFCTTCGKAVKEPEQKEEPAVEAEPEKETVTEEETETEKEAVAEEAAPKSFCTNCGAKLGEGLAFCTECGTKI